MITLNIKPLSVNAAWQGKRFKTPLYKKYIDEVISLLPNQLEFPDDKIRMEYVFGFSNTASDIDNPVKPITDILQHTYNFNDKSIYQMLLTKKIVPKGQEFIQFTILPYDKQNTNRLNQC